MRISDQGLIQTQAYINGEWVDADSGDKFTVLNPATGEAIADVAKRGTAETRRAILAAEAAMVSWRKKTAKERGLILRTWFNLLMENQEDLAQILTAEMGLPATFTPVT